MIRGEPGREQVVTIVPVRRAADGARVLGLPKGHIDPGETACRRPRARSARRPASWPSCSRDLGEVALLVPARRPPVSKSVVFFLFRYVSGDTADHDDEVEEARWIDLREAPTELSYAGEREMVARAARACWTESSAS